jgi:hypothetical protein
VKAAGVSAAPKAEVAGHEWEDERLVEMIDRSATRTE